MRKKLLMCLFFLLFHFSIIIIAYDFLFVFAKANHIAFVASSSAMIPLSIWGVVAIEIIVIIAVYLKKE